MIIGFGYLHFINKAVILVPLDLDFVVLKTSGLLYVAVLLDVTENFPTINRGYFPTTNRGLPHRYCCTPGRKRILYIVCIP